MCVSNKPLFKIVATPTFKGLKHASYAKKITNINVWGIKQYTQSRHN